MFDGCIPHVWWENPNLGLVKSHFFMVYFVHCCFVRRHCKWSSTLVGGWATSPRQAKGRQPRADNRIAIFHDYVRLPAYTNSYVIVCYNYLTCQEDSFSFPEETQGFINGRQIPRYVQRKQLK